MNTIITRQAIEVNAARYWGGSPAEQTIVLDAETYATLDVAHGLVTIHRGSRTGSGTDWGGQVIGSLELGAAMKIAQAVLDAQPAEDEEAQDEDAYYDMLAAREEMRRDALADGTSANWGFD